MGCAQAPAGRLPSAFSSTPPAGGRCHLSPLAVGCWDCLPGDAGDVWDICGVTAAGRAPGLDWVGLGVLLSPHRARDGPPLRATGPGVSSVRVRAWRPPLPR